MLHPAIVMGTIRDAGSGEPIPEAVVLTFDCRGVPLVRPTTVDDGTYLIRNVPAGRLLRVETEEFGTVEERAPNGTRADFSLERQLATGPVLDNDSSPIQGAIVQTEQRRTVSTGDGTFEFSGVTPDTRCWFWRRGTRDTRIGR
jgi:hypothetical protein